MLKPWTLRAEPLPVSPSSAIMIVGRANASTILLATIPMTPLCQPDAASPPNAPAETGSSREIGLRRYRYV